MVVAMSFIECVAKNGVKSRFYYKYSITEHLFIEHNMMIFLSPDYSDADFFEITAKEVGSNTLKIIMMNNNNQSIYKAKGIPDAAILELKAITGKIIRSSSISYPSDLNERRSESATKAWERLEKHGQASYNAADDYFFTV